MTVSFDVYYQCEGSCGEYFADITVTDSETGTAGADWIKEEKKHE